MVTTRSIAVCLVTLAVLTLTVVPVAGAPRADRPPGPPFNDTIDREYEPVGCLGIDITVRNQTTNATGLISENLTTTGTSVQATDELPPGAVENGTFQIKTGFLNPEEVCFAEPVNGTGSRLDLINVTTRNSTIIGPNIRTEYAMGTADAIRIESPLTVDELIAELI
ncbi:MAG: hypothetical protein U5K37_02820 [Natrialbaceae archaeon]|nr:hypothetical protein [Natrialbaceae archaeon]